MHQFSRLTHEVLNLIHEVQEIIDEILILTHQSQLLTGKFPTLTHKAQSLINQVLGRVHEEIIQKPVPKGRHSRLQGELCAAVNQVAEDQKIAYAFPKLRCSFGGRSIMPDVAVFQWQRIPFHQDGEVPDNFELHPDWVIEILSPEQEPNKVIGNILHCLQHGCRLGWFIDPDDRSVLILLPGQQPELLQRKDYLPVLKGVELELMVEQVFG